MQISSTIIEHMKEHCDLKSGFALAYFYFDFNDTEKQEVSTFVSSLIAQLCNQVVDIPEQLEDLYKRCNNGRQKATMRELKTILSRMMKDLEDVFIVVDALDECPKNGEREELLEFITEIRAWSSSNMHILATSRLEPDIKETLTPLLTSQAISIQGFQVESDIKVHVASQLAIDPRLKKWSSDIKTEIEKTLTAGANGM
jgi:ankyrin repeat domain-containing protein 50